MVYQKHPLRGLGQSSSECSECSDGSDLPPLKFADGAQLSLAHCDLQKVSQ